MQESFNFHHWVNALAQAILLEEPYAAYALQVGLQLNKTRPTAFSVK